MSSTPRQLPIWTKLINEKIKLNLKKIKWLHSKALYESQESLLVRSSRTACFNKLVDDGWLESSNEIAEGLIFYTFERCGIAANAAKEVINKKEGFERFTVVNLVGHYAIQSRITGLIYDLVGTDGLSLSDIEKLPYAEFCRLVGNDVLNRRATIERFKAVYFSEFTLPR
jgi:hypothetical protein